jgi:hypothetical protein
MRAKSLYLTCALLVVCFGAIVFAAGVDDKVAKKPHFKSVAANSAYRVYELRMIEIKADYLKALAELQRERDESIKEAQSKILAALDTAKSTAMKAEDLDEAIALRDAANKLRSTTDKAKVSGWEEEPDTEVGRKIAGHIRAFNARLPEIERLNKQRDEEGRYSKIYVRRSITERYYDELAAIKQIESLVRENQLSEDEKTKAMIDQMVLMLHKHQQKLLDYNKTLPKTSRLELDKPIELGRGAAKKSKSKRVVKDRDMGETLIAIKDHIRQIVHGVEDTEVYEVKARRRKWKARVKEVGGE